MAGLCFTIRSLRFCILQSSVFGMEKVDLWKANGTTTRRSATYCPNLQAMCVAVSYQLGSQGENIRILHLGELKTMA